MIAHFLSLSLQRRPRVSHENPAGASKKVVHVAGEAFIIIITDIVVVVVPKLLFQHNFHVQDVQGKGGSRYRRSISLDQSCRNLVAAIPAPDERWIRSAGYVTLRRAETSADYPFVC